MSITPTAKWRRRSTTPPRQRRAPATVRLRVDDIKKRAKELKFGQIQQMADEFGVSRQFVHAMFNHTSRPGPDTASAMASALQWTVDDLWEKR